MKHFLASYLIFALSAVGAQPVSFDSVRLADAIMASNWSSVEQALPTLIAGLESQMRASGVSERASKVFGEELRQSMSQDNLSRVIATVVTAKFTPDETRELSAFLQSKVGQKYLSINKDFSANPAYFGPIIKQACNGAVQRLQTTDKSSMSSICSRL